MVSEWLWSRAPWWSIMNMYPQRKLNVVSKHCDSGVITYYDSESWDESLNAYVDMHYFTSLSNQKILSSLLKLKGQGFIEIIDISKEFRLGLDISLRFKLSLSSRSSLLNRPWGSNSLRGKYFSELEDDLWYWRKI